MEPQSRDSEFRTHEQSHIASAGVLTKWSDFLLSSKSDEILYAVGGEVSIDISFSCPNPQATLQKAQHIRAAALVPADPSAQDRAVALSAKPLKQQLAGI
ncbi:putative metalloprotease CJM1_0395 family protein [Candidatus Nitrospira neomarina]|uniref:Metalloprotease CJM1_0395 family protein n=1 Tax=Candidatus Nitrospira neomarina TaxID=3020899 RepID=A0AA96GL13_9BACT|nr:putative metalloprotease CJM1_0395 family protein [Candidatus Nitrospira neomarina]WNM61008.1 putative metalloprotease CJM1_0395 family protein [Candidatus Nitrospira neomarina]